MNDVSIILGIAFVFGLGLFIIRTIREIFAQPKLNERVDNKRFVKGPIRQGKMIKGGHNDKPTTPRPVSRPQGQGKSGVK